MRLARVRLDTVAMLVHRHFWQSLVWAEVAIHIWCDASPQWRGFELFAASFDLLAPGFCQRRAFPFITPELGQDLTSKTVALLWQIFLVVGPTFLAVRAFCNRVVCICTDMGTERLMTEVADILDLFYSLIGDKTDYSHLRQDSLFPRAVHMPGWRHQFDTLLKRGRSVK